MRAIVVGSGVGGATAARELTRRGAEVIVLEAGRTFRPFTRRVGWTEPVRATGLLGRDLNVSRFIPAYRAHRSSEELLLVRAMAVGGCSLVSCGCMMRAEHGLKDLGLDLTQEYEELERAMGVGTLPRERWRPLTRTMFDAAADMGLDPRPTPKAVNGDRCKGCGLCVVGCATGARWDARRFLDEAEREGCIVRKEVGVKRVLVEGGTAKGVEAMVDGRTTVLTGDTVVLAAGGIGTAQVLKASGIAPSDTLWADLVLTIGGSLEGARQLEEAPMAWCSQREGYIISPYLDVLSHWFHRPWRKVGLRDRVGVMVKLGEAANGRVLEDGRVEKPLDPTDKERLRLASEEVKRLMDRAGVQPPYVDGLLHGGHLGGTVPLHREDVDTMHPSILPDGLWVTDLSLLPRSQGLPTMLTVAALSKRVASMMPV